MGERNRIFGFKPDDLMAPGNSSYDAMNHWLPQIYRKPTVEFKNKINPPDSNGKLNRLPPLTDTTTNSNHHLDFGYFGKPSHYQQDPGVPRMRTGRIGSTWRNITQVLGNRGNQVLFIDGAVKQQDNLRYPWAMGEFGPMESESSASYIPPRSFSSAKFAYPPNPINYDFEPLEQDQSGPHYGMDIAPRIDEHPASNEPMHQPQDDPNLDTSTGPPREVTFADSVEGLGGGGEGGE